MEFPEKHFKGVISFERSIEQGSINGDLGIQVSRDGRVWICIDGQALIRLLPEKIIKKYKGNKQ